MLDGGDSIDCQTFMMTNFSTSVGLFNQNSISPLIWLFIHHQKAMKLLLCFLICFTYKSISWSVRVTFFFNASTNASVPSSLMKLSVNLTSMKTIVVKTENKTKVFFLAFEIKLYECCVHLQCFTECSCFLVFKTIAC